MALPRSYCGCSRLVLPDPVNCCDETIRQLSEVLLPWRRMTRIGSSFAPLPVEGGTGSPVNPLATL
jgi:hypothetical protein